MKPASVALFFIALCAAARQAAAADDGPPKGPVAPNVSVDKEYVAISKQPSSEFWSYFSAGLLYNGFGKYTIDSAEIRDGNVRILKRNRFAAGVGLQAFYPLHTKVMLRSADFLPADNPNKVWKKYSETGFGPYASLSIGTSDLIDTIGVGFAVSVRRREGGVRLGIGAVVDLRAQHLAADYQENTAAPAGATEVKYVQEAALGGQLMITFTPGFSD